jgi:hypothetical protein
MSGKKAETKFTIQFNRRDADHMQVADILNRQVRCGKAQYIVDAVMHYISCGQVVQSGQPVRIDENHIEEIVGRLLRENQGGGLAVAPVASPAGQDEPQEHTQSAQEVIFEDTVDALSGEGLGAIAGALDMFRKK